MSIRTQFQDNTRNSCRPMLQQADSKQVCGGSINVPTQPNKCTSMPCHQGLCCADGDPCYAPKRRDLTPSARDDHERLKGEDSSTEEVYEIDYRGPETHPILPFPPRGRPRLRRQHPYFKPPPQSKDSKVNRERG
ncbi:hypothetical protein CRG98_011466 [Punica granatum]|uniref:Uncharacterized protein n=1 Tax=Punica granatum TaxID=22663 RepID=A0A2I0KI17_PUNGR|nr:hypothetical protein CRG98_011466 [Punica granatum]